MKQVGFEALENLFSNFCMQKFKLNSGPRFSRA